MGGRWRESCPALRKGRRSREEARDAVTGWAEGYRLVETSATAFTDALELATSHRLGFRGSLILAAAAQAECRLLLTEDLQDGFTWRGVTVRNPFAAPG